MVKNTRREGYTENSSFLRAILVAIVSGLIGLLAGGAGVLISVGQYAEKVRDHETVISNLVESNSRMREFIAAQSQVNANTAEILARLAAYHEPSSKRR